MYAAKTYMMNKLAQECEKFLESHLNPCNVCSILENGVFFERNDLIKKSLVKIQRNAYLVFQSESFKNISTKSLQMILQLDELNATEIDVFKACVEWAKAECQRKNLGNTAGNLRSVLELSLPLIRFPTMSLDEFSQVVVGSGILSDTESLRLFKYLTSSQTLEHLPFTTRKRINHFVEMRELTFNMLNGPVHRFEAIETWSKVCDLQCHISDAVQIQKINIHGFRIGGTFTDRGVKCVYNVNVSQGKTLYAFNEAKKKGRQLIPPVITCLPETSVASIDAGTFTIQVKQGIDVTVLPKGTSHSRYNMYSPPKEPDFISLEYHPHVKELLLSDEFVCLNVAATDWNPLVSIEYNF